MNQTCVSGTAFADAAYCYGFPCSGCGAYGYVDSALLDDLEGCLCQCSCPCAAGGARSGFSPQTSASAAEQTDSCAGTDCVQNPCGSQKRLCCDEDGSCCTYPASCRETYWPEFSHPRWLSCAQLYDGGDHYASCTANGGCGCS